MRPSALAEQSVDVLDPVAAGDEGAGVHAQIDAVHSVPRGARDATYRNKG